MTTAATLTFSVKSLIKAKTFLDEATSPVISTLKDVNIPLDVRWDAFTKLVEANLFVNKASYGDGFIDMYKKITNNYHEDFVEACKPNLEKWQEAVLASVYTGFTYDW